ncbi:uncharacterized protein OCT59_008481 [Rhizophagus irregularis]|uniref:uncharacterized protein n=1 Tax=Rhizophagus irregularis TaxID=588596 RepID=UPI0033172C1F|nr:hypothetical protein OCT59_008481 [Rhizophagus irregularis]
MICDIVLKSQVFVIDEFDEFEELDGFGDAMEPSDHAPRFTSLNISSIANLDHTILYYTPGQTKMYLFFAC